MKKERVLAGGMAAVLVLSLTACGGNGGDSETAGTLSALSAGTAVQVQAVARENISTDNKVSGRVAAEEEATVMVAVNAKCTAVYVDAGDEVRQGERLCTLDLSSTLSQYNAAQISYDSAVQSFNDQKGLFDKQVQVAREQVTVAERQITVTEQQIAASEQTLAASEQGIAASEQTLAASQEQLNVSQGQIPVMEQQIATTKQQITLMGPQIDLAVKNYHDTEALLAIGAASQMEVDNAKIQADQAAFGRDQANLQLSQLEAQLEQTKAQMVQSQAQLEQSRAQLEQSKAQLEASRAQIDQSRFSLTQLELQRDNAQVQVDQLLSTRNSTLAQLEAGIENARAGVQQLDAVLEDVDEYGNVIAPISGTLVTFNATENSYIPTTMPLAVIDGQDEMKLTASVSEALVPKLRAGDTADVYISALDRNLTAVIRSVERAANVQTRLYTVTLTLNERPRGLYAGMFADVTFHTDQVSDAVVVPSEAILTSGSTEYVYIVEAGSARYVEVETGMTGTGVTEILSGLRGGEALVTAGQSYLTDGDPVRVVSGEQ